MRALLEKVFSNKTRPLAGLALGPMSSSHEEDHSLDHLIENLALSPDLLELDIRKSADGIIFCHHGSIPFGVLYAQLFFRFLSFRFILRQYPNIKTTDEMIRVIPDSVMIMLDIKQSNITPNDILSIVKSFPRKQFWVNAPSLRRLKKIKSVVGEEILYTIGYPLLFPSISISKIAGWVDVVPVFFWQTNPDFLSRLKKIGVDYSIARWFISQKEREEIGQRIDSAWIYYRNIPSK